MAKTPRSPRGAAAAAAPAAAAAGKAKLTCLVTGGAGFLGQHLVAKLKDSGKYAVRVFDIRDTGVLKGVDIITGDLRDAEQVARAVAGCDVVFHCATAAPTGENALNKALMDGVNVKGTQNVIDGCIKARVPKLVYTSSASVVFEGQDCKGVTESTPYASHPFDYYTQTKIDGEKLVLAANGRGGLATVALRPSGIFGESDPLFVPTVVRNAQAGKMKYIMGAGDNLMDFTYVGNVADAHLLAADALAAGSKLAGSAYFITNREPRPFWGVMGDVCAGLGYERPRIHLPVMLVLAIAFLFEYVIRPLLAPIKTLNSDFTVNRIKISTSYRCFSSDRAAKDFNYRPAVSMDDAMKRTLASFKHLRKDAKK